MANNKVEGSDTQTPALSPEDFFRQLRALRDQLPELQTLPQTVKGNRLGHANPEFVQASLNATSASTPVQTALGRTDEDVRQEIAVADRWSAVAGELRAMLQLVVVANTMRRKRIGLAALQTFNICQQLARDPAHESLVPHVEEMQRLNRFGRKRSRKAQPQPEPEIKAKPQA